MASPAESRERFLAAVRDARKGHYAPGNRLIESVRQRFGDKAAEIQRKELRNYVDSGKKA
jgi:hypothetical protein